MTTNKDKTVDLYLLSLILGGVALCLFMFNDSINKNTDENMQDVIVQINTFKQSATKIVSYAEKLEPSAYENWKQRPVYTGTMDLIMSMCTSVIDNKNKYFMPNTFKTLMASEMKSCSDMGREYKSQTLTNEKVLSYANQMMETYRNSEYAQQDEINRNVELAKDVKGYELKHQKKELQLQVKFNKMSEWK